MSPAQSATESVESGIRGGRRTVSRTIDWGVPALLLVGGLLAGLLASVLLGAADRVWITSLVADGTLTSSDLTDAQLIDVSTALLWWAGIGLLVIAGLMLVGGVAFGLSRRRTRHTRLAGEDTGPGTAANGPDTAANGPDTAANAIAGGVTSVVLSVVPFAPVLGGLVAGYLQGGSPREGMRIGAMAGAIAAIPLAVLFTFLLVGVVLVAGDLALGGTTLVVAVGLSVGLLGAIAYMIALGAVGGYVGVDLAPAPIEEAA